MTPEERAKALIDKFYQSEDAVMGGYGEVPECYYESAKACAKICVEEVLNFMIEDDKKNGDCRNINSPEYRSWEKTKSAIDLLNMNSHYYKK